MVSPNAVAAAAAAVMVYDVILHILGTGWDSLKIKSRQTMSCLLKATL